MRIDQSVINEHNQQYISKHKDAFGYTASRINNTEAILEKLIAFQIAIPSWALGTGGTRFGRFSGGGEPRSIEEKIADVGLLHALNKSSGSISLHIPWDIPSDYAAIKSLASAHGISFDAVNSNTFQDQPQQPLSYKYGSLQHVDKAVRRQAIEHNIEVIKHGMALGSKALSVWLSDGSCFPGQLNFSKAFKNTLESLEEIYEALPSDWKIYIEYKAFEPNFYSTTVGDWGQSYLFTSKLGDKAKTLVDLGHHLPNANIEQIVSLLMMENKLAGFHFNDSKYGDDDLTAGSINPYQLFLIFNELVQGMNHQNMNHATDLSWMIDASHNVKDPLEDLLQSVEAIKIAYAQALLIDAEMLSSAQQRNDATMAQEILQNSFRTDVRPLLTEARIRSAAAINPIELFRKEKLRDLLISERGTNTIATGL
jgi:L-rhamnose isomerase/sugar isomerase